MENNNAKNSVLIINNLSNFSLQVSLQKQLLNHSLQRTFRLQPFCNCKRFAKKVYLNTRHMQIISFAGSFAEILN